MTGFDDFLELKTASFRSTRLAVFTGVSGSGKSTAIQWLIQHHPDFQNRPIERVIGGGLDWTVPAVENGLVVVDDLIRPRELYKLIRLLIRGNQVLLAAHLHPAWFALLRIGWSTQLWRTDVNREKLARHLKAERIEFTQVNRIVPNTDRAIWICSTFWNAIPIVVLIVPCVYFENTAEWNNPL